jgi:hypothetical protein
MYSSEQVTYNVPSEAAAGEENTVSLSKKPLDPIRVFHFTLEMLGPAYDACLRWLAEPPNIHHSLRPNELPVGIG